MRVPTWRHLFKRTENLSLFWADLRGRNHIFYFGVDCMLSHTRVSNLCIRVRTTSHIGNFPSLILYGVLILVIRDCTSENIMLDPSTKYPNSFHPSDINRKRNFRGKASMTPPMGLRSKCHCAAATSQHLKTRIDKFTVIGSQMMYNTLETWFGRNF